MMRIGFSGLVAAAVALTVTASAGAQTTKPTPDRQPKPQPATGAAQPAKAAAAASLGSVRIPRGVSANGQPLPAGTYTVRLASEGVPGKVGQTADLSRWCEFVQGSEVKGKELCTVLSSSEVGAVVKDAPPASGASKVQMLKGNDYLRIWINRGGTHYLMHLPAAGQENVELRTSN
jgi:hypothetical protein